MQGDSFRTTDHAVPHWPRLDVCRPRLARNLNSRRLLCSRFTGGKIRWPSLWSKGMVSGSVLFSGRRGCIDQEDDVLFLPLPPCCSTHARGKRLQSFAGQLQRHSTRQRRQSNHSFVTEHIETTASVSYHNKQYQNHKVLNMATNNPNLIANCNQEHFWGLTEPK